MGSICCECAQGNSGSVLFEVLKLICHHSPSLTRPRSGLECEACRGIVRSQHKTGPTGPLTNGDKAQTMRHATDDYLLNVRDFSLPPGGRTIANAPKTHHPQQPQQRARSNDGDGPLSCLFLQSIHQFDCEKEINRANIAASVADDG